MIVKDFENSATARVGKLFKLLWLIVSTRKEMPDTKELRQICQAHGVSYYDVIELFNKIKERGYYGK